MAVITTGNEPKSLLGGMVSRVLGSARRGVAAGTPTPAQQPALNFRLRGATPGAAAPQPVVGGQLAFNNGRGMAFR
jgi:hypothetical protein